MTSLKWRNISEQAYGCWKKEFDLTLKHMPKLQNIQSYSNGKPQLWETAPIPVLCSAWDNFRISIASHHNGTTMHPPEPGAAEWSGGRGRLRVQTVGGMLHPLSLDKVSSGSRSSNNTIHFQDVKLRDGINPCLFKTFSSVQRLSAKLQRQGPLLPIPRI